MDRIKNPGEVLREEFLDFLGYGFQPADRPDPGKPELGDSSRQPSADKSIEQV